MTAAWPTSVAAVVSKRNLPGGALAARVPESRALTMSTGAGSSSAPVPST